MIYAFTSIGPDRVISGIGALNELQGALQDLGAKRPLLITGRISSRSVSEPMIP